MGQVFVVSLTAASNPSLLAAVTLMLAVLFSFPGASYIAAMDLLHKQHLTTVATVLAVLAFNVIMLALLEIPLLGYTIKPEATGAAVAGVSNWLARSGGRVLLIVGAGFAVILIVRGLVNW